MDSSPSTRIRSPKRMGDLIMIQITRRIGASTALLICTSIAAVAAHAQSASFTTPHVTTATGSETVQLGGVTFTNQGLVGVGRLAASTRDFAGETLGSF